MLAALIPVLGGIGARVAASLFPDPADKLKAQELENKLTSEIMANAAAIEEAAAKIINTEAASQHWLAANWRPLTMITFVALIVARWFGWSAPGLTDAEALALWDIVELGLGGYVVGRSAEKIAPTLIKALGKG